MATVIQGVELPVTLTPERSWSDGEVERFCAENRDLRIERLATGSIVMMNPTSTRTGRSNADLTGQLWLWARTDGRGFAFDSNTGYTLADTSILSPDASWLSFARWNALSAQNRVGFARVCPEFVVELRSDSDALPALRLKMSAWLRNGAELAWLLDPARRSVEIYRSDKAVEILQGPEFVEGEGPVAGFRLETRSIWDQP